LKQGLDNGSDLRNFTHTAPIGVACEKAELAKQELERDREQKEIEAAN
jgi:hypothetical protein